MNFFLILVCFLLAILQGCNNASPPPRESVQFNSYVNENTEKATPPEKNAMVNVAF